jgi:hypothetical protein
MIGLASLLEWGVVQHGMVCTARKEVYVMIKRIAEALENGQKVHIMLHGDDEYFTEGYEETVFRILDHDATGILLKGEESAILYVPWGAVKMLRLVEAAS